MQEANAVQRIQIIMMAGLAVAGGCASRPPEINTGLASIDQGKPSARVAVPDPVADAAPSSELEAMMRQAALDTQRALEELSRPAARAEPPPAASAEASLPRTGLLEVSAREASAGAGAEGPGSLTEPEPGALVPGEPAMGLPGASEQAAARTPEERLGDAADGLAEVLREQAGAGSLRAHLVLSALELIRGQGAGPAPGGLTAGQSAALEAFRGVVTAAGSVAERDDGSADLADRFRALAEGLEERQPLRITRAELCTRVTGFGRYTPFAAARFPAGRGQRAIVYVEVDRFVQRELGTGDEAREPGDRYVVELSQELNLYNESGSLLALRHPEQKVVETSRNRRRDFYLVNEIALPPTLSVGRYNLKVTMRDKSDGAVAETVIPIDIVVDTATARAPG